MIYTKSLIAIFDDICHDGTKNAGNCKIRIEYAMNKCFSYMLVEQTNIPYQSKKETLH